MKRIYNPTTVTDTMDNLDKMRRLYRGVNDIAKRIEEEKSNWKSVADVFTSSQEVLRAKLRDYCEKLIYQDFQGHGRKIEELLWRKGFYEVFCAAKKLRKGNIWTDTEKAMVSLHLSGGVGFYNHLILGLQLEHNLEIIGTPDIKYTIKQSGLINNATTKSITKEIGKDNEECKKAVLRFIHRSLICIGDLARYKLDLDPLWVHWLMAVRYYKMANSIDHTIGMPHNQLGTVAGSQNYGLDAAYHYLRCMMCPGTFEGAESNLKRIITMHSYTGNEEVALHRCISRLLFLLQLWDSEEPNIQTINQESQALLNDIQICLEMEPSADLESDSLSFFKQIKTTKPEVISDEMVFKIVSICLMYITKLQSKKLIQVQGATAFTLALLSQLVKFVTTQIEKSFTTISSLTAKDFQIEDYEFSEEDKNTATGSDKAVNCNSKRYSARHKARNLLTKLRRSRRRMNSSDSDASDVENGAPVLSDDDVNSDISETGEDAFSCDGTSDPSDEDDELEELELKTQKLNVDGNQNGDLDEPVKRYLYVRSQLKPQHIFDVLSACGLLGSIKICYDWLMSDPEVLERCARSASSLIKRTCKLINLINFDVAALWHTMKEEALVNNSNCWEIYTSLDKALEFSLSVALPEDVELRGIPIFRNVHANLDWQKSLNQKMNPREESLMRILKLVSFGEYLCKIKDHSGVVFDSPTRLFRVVETNIVDEPVKEVEEVEEQVVDDFSEVNHVVQYMNDIANNMAEQVASADSTAMVSPTVGITDNALSNGTKKNEQPLTNMINIEEEKGKLMRNMGTLWLQAEVEALEHRLDSKLMPPFLVPDHEVLVKFMPTLKRLVYSKKFVVVIPSIVISTLDEVKRSSAQAREATRWLETQLERGSRFLKAQRPNERLALPYIKGPKPKEKESWIYFQIIECCYYLTQKTINFKSDGVESPVVTLLLGYNNQSNNELARSSIASSEVLAKSAGINIEHVQVFHTKWKASSKSHG